MMKSQKAKLTTNIFEAVRKLFALKKKLKIVIKYGKTIRCAAHTEKEFINRNSSCLRCHLKCLPHFEYEVPFILEIGSILKLFFVSL